MRADGSKRINWTEDEIILALTLYLRNPSTKEQRFLAQQLGRTEGAVKFKIGNLMSWDKSVREAGKKGFEHCSRLDEFVWNQYIGENFEKPLTALLERVSEIAPMFGMRPEQIMIGVDTEGLRLTKERLHQSFFRTQMLNRYGLRCLVTGRSLDQMLEVAHIIPWAENKNLRMTITNGLVLNPFVHKAYDKNLLGIDPSYRVHIADRLIAESEGGMREFLHQLNGSSLMFAQRARPNRDYLDVRYQEFLNAQ